MWQPSCPRGHVSQKDAARPMSHYSIRMTMIAYPSRKKHRDDLVAQHLPVPRAAGQSMQEGVSMIGFVLLEPLG